MGIGEKLRSRRQDLQMTRNQLAEQIHVTPSAIANYENGVSYPKPDILISLIIALGIDANYLYQDYFSQNKIQTFYDFELTEEEKVSVSKYKELTDTGKKMVRMFIDDEYKRIKENEWVTFPCLLPGVRKLHAGFLLSEDSPNIQLKKKYLLEGMELCFQIQLDRYQPVFKKYDILALQKTPAAHNEMGIFYLNGIYYIRTLSCHDGIIKLCSLNVIDPDIVVKPSDSFHCIGKILGHVYGSYRFVDKFN